MKINLKSGSSGQKEIDISETATVKDFRAEVAKSFSTEPTQIVLIFAGKILKDETSLTDNKIVDGVSVHVVVKKGNTPAPQNASTPASNPAPQPAAPTSNTQSPSGNPFGAMGGLLNSGNLQQASQELMRNPEMMQNMLNNPMVQSIGLKLKNLPVYSQKLVIFL